MFLKFTFKLDPLAELPSIVIRDALEDHLRGEVIILFAEPVVAVVGSDSCEREVVDWARALERAPPRIQSGLTYAIVIAAVRAGVQISCQIILENGL